MFTVSEKGEILHSNASFFQRGRECSADGANKLLQLASLCATAKQQQTGTMKAFYEKPHWLYPLCAIF